MGEEAGAEGTGQISNDTEGDYGDPGDQRGEDAC
jgi:hypothetical protein